MKIRLEVTLTKTDGPRQTREVVADVLPDELPSELWIDDTGYDLEWQVLND